MKPAIVITNQIVGNAVIRALAEKGMPVIAVHYRSNEFGYLSRYVTESVFRTKRFSRNPRAR